MENKTQVSHNGVGFGGLLAIAFIVLKLTGYISWPWVWVLSPLWIPIVLILGFIGVAFVIAAVITLILDRSK